MGITAVSPVQRHVLASTGELPRARTPSPVNVFDCAILALDHRTTKKASPLSMIGALAFFKKHPDLAQALTLLAPIQSPDLTGEALGELAALMPSLKFIMLSGTDIDALPESLNDLKDLQAILCVGCKNLTADKIPESLRDRVFLEAPADITDQ